MRRPASGGAVSGQQRACCQHPPEAASPHCPSPSKGRSRSCPWLATPSLCSFFSQHTELLWVEKRYADALPPGNCERDRPWRQASLQMERRWVIRVGPDPTRLVSLQNGDTWTEGQTCTEGRRHDHRGRDWSDASTSQGHRGLPGGAGRDSPREPAEERGTSET